MPSQSRFSKRNIASFSLIFMSMQILGIEGFAISMPKVIYMCMSPLLMLSLSPKMSKAVILSALFWTVTVLLQIIQYDDVRMSTLYYTLMFLSVFCLFYNLVWLEHCYSLDEFLKVVKIVIFAYSICLILQQGAMLIGRRRFPLFNLMGWTWQELFRLNSLAIEPSHAARVLTVYFYAFLKLLEFRNGRPISIAELFGQHWLLVFSFLYTILAIGSGTAMVGLAILSLYFIKRQYVMLVVSAAFLFYYFAPMIDYDPFNRALATFEATLTLDEEEIQTTDNSAYTRVGMLTDFIKYTDLTDTQLWFGYGEDTTVFRTKHSHPTIVIYGLISYLLKLLLFYSCSFCGFFSLSTLVFVLMFTLNIGNIHYGFACLMVFSAVKYFQTMTSKN